MRQFIQAYGDVLEMLEHASGKDRGKIVKAWDQCEKEGKLNGFQAPAEIRKKMRRLFVVTNKTPPELRISLRKDIRRTLRLAAKYRHRKRALE